MVEMALVFVGFAMLILLLLLLSSIYYVPRALAEEEHEVAESGAEELEQPPAGQAH